MEAALSKLRGWREADRRRWDPGEEEEGVQ